MRDCERKTYMCIDLKCFYASVECVARGMSPDTAQLVVADPSRKEKTICLAISPRMKELGVRNRCRVFEIPEGIEYFKAKPRMRLYMQKSAEIYALYLRRISPADIYPYSIDECFIDATSYLPMYGMTAREFAQSLIDDVKREVGIRATAGIGENLFLAKVALDVLAKHDPEFIGELDESSFRARMWHHTPITDIWNIGPGIAARLAKHGARTLFDVTRLPEELLYREFGANAEFLIDHAWGQEPCTITDIKAYKPKGRSIANGQVLKCGYAFDDARVVLREMVESSALDMLEKGLAARRVSVHVGYENISAAKAAALREAQVFDGGHGRRIVGPGARNDGWHESTGGATTLDSATNSFRALFKAAAEIYDSHVDRSRSVKRIMLGFSQIEPAEGSQLNLFDAPEEEQRERDLQKAMLAVQSKFGKNAVLFGTSYREKATMRERNGQIGGHNAG